MKDSISGDNSSVAGKARKQNHCDLPSVLEKRKGDALA